MRERGGLQGATFDREAEHLCEERGHSVRHDGLASVDDLVQQQHAITPSDGFGGSMAPVL